MSRIGKMPVAVPASVKTKIDGSTVHIEGPKGKLSYALRPGLIVKSEAGSLHVSIGEGFSDSDVQLKADFGTARARLNSMVKGVSEGWKKALELNGVGFTAVVAGQKLTLQVGFSHDVIINLPAVVKGSVVKNVLTLESCDRQVLGNTAADIRAVHKPEPYLGKGIKYVEEVIRRKVGKTVKK